MIRSWKERQARTVQDPVERTKLFLGVSSQLGICNSTYGALDPSFFYSTTCSGLDCGVTEYNAAVDWTASSHRSHR